MVAIKFIAAVLYIFIADCAVYTQISITLYTRTVPKGVALSSSENYYNAAYDKTKVTKFTTNGWVKKWDPTFPNITSAYLNKTDVNVINVNWATLAGDMNGTLGLQNFYFVGDAFLDLLTKLVANGSSASNFHLIGHGSGAHVCGYAGQRLFTTKNIKVDRITALDPTIKTVRNLTSSDAQFVDVIHTSDVYGTYKALGIVDFYPNNGLNPQAGCGYFYEEMVACSNYMSIVFFENSIINATKYLATKCRNYEDYKDSLCTQNPTTYMGESVDRNATGSYYLSIYLRSSRTASLLKRLFGRHKKSIKRIH